MESSQTDVFQRKSNGDKIVLIKDDNTISDDKVIAEPFNSHFVTITDSLGLDPTFKDVGIHKAPDKKIDAAVKKYKDHPSIIAIKKRLKWTIHLNLGLLLC